MSWISSLSSRGIDWSAIANSLLRLGEARLGLNRFGSVERLPDYLRRDIGLPASDPEAIDPRSLRW